MKIMYGIYSGNYYQGTTFTGLAFFKKKNAIEYLKSLPFDFKYSKKDDFYYEEQEMLVYEINKIEVGDI